MTNKGIIALIPARGGSKRLPGKNIRPLLGKPLIAYAIEAARACPDISQVIVSTDDQAIATVARQFGAQVPFLRPPELASDTASSLDVEVHAIQFLEKELGYPLETIVLVQATSPLVIADDIHRALQQMEHTQTKSCVSLSPINDRPEWMYRLEGELPRPYLPERYHQVRSQDMPPLYRINGSLFLTRRDTIINDHKIVDDQSLSAIIIPRERSLDIDELSDFMMAEALLTYLHQQQ